MSWREILRAPSAASSRPQNTHNEQNSAHPNNSADCADIAPEGLTEKERLTEALAATCKNPASSLPEIMAVITLEDHQSWHRGEIGNAALVAFTSSLQERLEMNRGLRPSHYNRTAVCEHCGSIWLWFDGYVQGCPWCWNR